MKDPTVDELFDLSGRAAMITGASGWLGGAMAMALAEAGADVIVASRQSSRAAKVASQLPRRKGNCHYAVVLDQLDEHSIGEGFESAVAEAGHVDILINNAHAADSHDLTDVTMDRFNEVLSNASGWFYLSRHFRDHAVKRGVPGCIINIGSMYGLVGSYPDAYQDICPASPVSYQALKGGILQMTRHLAVYWAPDRIRVNCLNPGPFPSPQAPAELVERLKHKSPMGRIGRPHELKGALLLLASDAGSYITGQHVTVDGGWTAW